MKTDIEHLSMLQDQKAKELSTLSDLIKQEITMIKTSLATQDKTLQSLSDQLKQTQDRLSKSIQSQPVTANGFIADQWRLITTKFQKGEAFESEIHALIPMVGGYKNVLDAVHPIVAQAGQTTRPFSALKEDLDKIEDSLNANATDDIDVPWYKRVWRKAKGLVTFESIDAKPIKINDTDKRMKALEAIKMAKASIINNRFEAAVQSLKSQEVSSKPLFDQWLTDAEKRLSLEKAMETLRSRITPFLQK
jgi:hypothetical protein